jgi:hypothetical protein
VGEEVVSAIVGGASAPDLRLRTAYVLEGFPSSSTEAKVRVAAEAEDGASILTSRDLPLPVSEMLDASNVDAVEQIVAAAVTADTVADIDAAAVAVVAVENFVVDNGNTAMCVSVAESMTLKPTTPSPTPITQILETLDVDRALRDEMIFLSSSSLVSQAGEVVEMLDAHLALEQESKDAGRVLEPVVVTVVVDSTSREFASADLVGVNQRLAMGEPSSLNETDVSDVDVSGEEEVVEEGETLRGMDGGSGGGALGGGLVLIGTRRSSVVSMESVVLQEMEMENEVRDLACVGPEQENLAQPTNAIAATGNVHDDVKDYDEQEEEEEGDAGSVEIVREAPVIPGVGDSTGSHANTATSNAMNDGSDANRDIGLNQNQNQSSTTDLEVDVDDEEDVDEVLLSSSEVEDAVLMSGGGGVLNSGAGGNLEDLESSLVSIPVEDEVEVVLKTTSTLATSVKTTNVATPSLSLPISTLAAAAAGAYTHTLPTTQLDAEAIEVEPRIIAESESAVDLTISGSKVLSSSSSIENSPSYLRFGWALHETAQLESFEEWAKVVMWRQGSMNPAGYYFSFCLKQEEPHL